MERLLANLRQEDNAKPVAGRKLEFVAVSARDGNRDIAVDGIAWQDDAVTMATRRDVDVLVELIDGSEGVARRIVEAAIERGKHVVTANEALLAHHGGELAKRPDARGVFLGFEAAVAGRRLVLDSRRIYREARLSRCFARVPRNPVAHRVRGRGAAIHIAGKLRVHRWQGREETRLLVDGAATVQGR